MPTPPVIGAVHAPPSVETETIPDIKPMRRGRPTKVGEEGSIKVTKPSPSPLRPSEDDPFTALDSKGQTNSDNNLDDVSSRFPALDDFSILHEEGNRFSFDQKSDASTQPKQDISQRVTNALADDAFAQVKGSGIAPSTQSSTRAPSMASKPVSRPISSHLVQPRQDSRAPSSERQISERPSMISTGTMTSPPSSPKLRAQQPLNRPVWRVPQSSEQRSLSQPRKSNADQNHLSTVRSEAALRPPLMEHRSKSQTNLTDSASKRASVEASQRSINAGDGDDSLRRSVSAKTKSRPSSMQSSKPSLLQRMSRDKPQGEAAEELARLTTVDTANGEENEDATRIDSNVAYLKAVEGEDASKRKEKRVSSGSRHIKRASLPSVSLSGTKQLLAGRFGEAFRKFEHSNNSNQRLLSESPPGESNDLTPIAGSEATDGRSDDGKFDEVEDVSPEMRRELERRRLSEEEKRVTDAATAYKQRVAQGVERAGPSSKAASIQSKVKSLLDETGRGSPSPTKTAYGYGKYTDQQLQTLSPRVDSQPVRTSSRQAPPSIISRPPHMDPVSSKPNAHAPKPAGYIPPPLTFTNSAPASSANVAKPEGPSLSVRPRPSGPPKPQPKPQSLRTGEITSPPPPNSTARPVVGAVPQPSSLPTSQQKPPPPLLDGNQEDDWEKNFSKRYPDLSGLEMVETEIDQREANANTLNKSSSLKRDTKVRDV